MSKEAEIKKLEDQKKKADPKLAAAIEVKIKALKSGKPVTK